MVIKTKSWVWWATWPFAHPTSGMFTLVGHTLYCPRGKTPSETILKHEEIHLEQIKRVTMFGYYFLYLFVLPFLWNPFRWKWETEAYEVAQGLTKDQIRAKLKGAHYGWLLGMVIVVLTSCAPQGIPVSVIRGIELAGELNQENTLRLLSETDIIIDDACDGNDGCYDCARTIWIKPNSDWKMCVSASHEILHRLSTIHFGDCDFDHIRFIYDAAFGDCEREFR